MSNLVIVESPTKAKTITKFLGPDYQVTSSFGHVRDLPESKLGVDVENNYEPKYVVPPKAKKTVDQLKALAKKADLIYFATDEDREGEAISWHLTELIKPKPSQIKRIVFHEITKEAILEALKNPRGLDLNLVNAQQARRILDRLVGYKLSPLLWHKVAKGLSAGRVQSVAVRLVVEREKEIKNFSSQEFWTIDAVFSKDGEKFGAKLFKVKNKTLDKLAIKNQAAAEKILDSLKGSEYQVAKVDKKTVKKNPLPPFTTSTLQQTANNRLGFSAKQTMMLAQQLYEQGYITYMRTDSVNLAEKFLAEAKKYLTQQFGNQFTEPKKYQTKAKTAQEAHEAIRPTVVFNAPKNLINELNKNQFKLYQLVWQRALASQMSPALLDTATVDINDKSQQYTFRATGSVIKFPGFLKVYPSSTKENILPELAVKNKVKTEEIKPNQHFTQPPPRYTEASLVKALEERGIGRPSTYAPTLATIQERNYVEKIDRQLQPTDIAFVVNDLLVNHFPQVVDYEFTAKMEDELDQIAAGRLSWQTSLQAFYQPFAATLAQKEQMLSKKDITEEKTDEVCEKCGQPMVIKMGRYGKFLACTGYPECKNTKELDKNGEPEPEPEPLNEKCPECGAALVRRRGRYGEFIGCSGYPKCKYIKKEPPREFGVCPKCGTGKIVQRRGRRGTFFACNNYPKCKNIYNRPPTGEKCPKCGELLLQTKDGVRCGNKECDFKK